MSQQEEFENLQAVADSKGLRVELTGELPVPTAPRQTTSAWLYNVYSGDDRVKHDLLAQEVRDYLATVP